MEIGLYTFADMQPEAVAGGAMKTHRRIQNLMEEITLADELGLDVFGIGEHHRPDYSVSSPATILAAAAVLTKHIKLTSAVTVLSSDDPIRVFQQFATVDQLSAGRAEIMVGRGSFIESFPLFGYDLGDYDVLFSEKLDLLLKLSDREKITWEGRKRAKLNNLGVYPRPYQERMPVWIAVGGTPASAVRAGTLALPMAVAIIGGYPDQFVPFVSLYRESAKKAGHDPSRLQLGINSHVYVAQNSQQAADEFFPAYSEMMNPIGRERGWPPLSREQFELSRGPRGALLVGDPDEVAAKMLYEHDLFGYTRFLAQMSMGTLAHDKVMASIRLFAEKVSPQVKQAIREKTTGLKT